MQQSNEYSQIESDCGSFHNDNDPFAFVANTYSAHVLLIASDYLVLMVTYVAAVNILSLCLEKNKIHDSAFPIYQHFKDAAQAASMMGATFK